MGVDG